MFAALLLVRLGLRKILYDVRTVCISWTALAASSRQQDRLIAGRFGALVLDVTALNPRHYPALLVDRHTFTFDTVHDAERGTQVGEPG